MIVVSGEVGQEPGSGYIPMGRLFRDLLRMGQPIAREAEGYLPDGGRIGGGRSGIGFVCQRASTEVVRIFQTHETKLPSRDKRKLRGEVISFLAPQP